MKFFPTRAFPGRVKIPVRMKMRSGIRFRGTDAIANEKDVKCDCRKCR